MAEECRGVASLTALASGEVFGLCPESCLLAMHVASRSARGTTDVFWAAIVSWGHPDKVLRIKNHKAKPATNFLYPSHGEIGCFDGCVCMF